MSRRSEFRARQDAAIGRPDVCECCCNGIDGLDAAARHLCGNCSMKDLADPYQTMEAQCSRIHELENTLQQVLDVAKRTEMFLPDGVKVTFKGTPDCYTPFVPLDDTMEVTWSVRGCQLDDEARRGFVKGMADEIERLGDWSALKKANNSIEMRNNTIAKLRARVDYLLKWIEKAVKEERNDHACKRIDAVASVWTLGGSKAMRSAIMSGHDEA